MYSISKNRKLSLLCAGVILFQTIVPAWALSEYSADYVQAVNNQRLSAYGNLEQKKIEAEAPRTWWECFKGPKFTPRVQKRTKREIQELLCKASPAQAVDSNAVIDISSVGKMELVRGEEKKHLNLIYYLTNILGGKGNPESAFNTQNGLKVCAEMLTQPTSTYEDVNKNPSVIKAFLEDRDLNNSYEEITHRMKGAEESFLDFFAEEQPFDKQATEAVYFGNAFADRNRSAYALEARTRLHNFTDALTVANIPFIIWMYSSILHLKGINISPYLTSLNKFMKGDITARKLEKSFSAFDQLLHKEPASFTSALFKHGIPDSLGVTLHIPFYLKYIFKQTSTIPDFGPRLAAYGTLLSLIATQSYVIYMGINNAVFKNNIATHIQGKMIGAATYINSIRELYLLAKQHPHIIENMPELEVLECLIESSDKHSEKFNELIKLLNTNTCKGAPSFFSIMGRALAAHTLMQDLKESGEFGEILRVAGKLETLWALSRVVKAHEDSEHPYCFVDFVDQKTPYILAEDFCNPFVPAKYTVSNSIEMNNDASGHIILTGPNTGGKSTLIKALWINAVLAQSFGIAYAKKMVMTPFYKLSSYLNITDNVSEGISLFKAEIKRARELRDLLTGLKADQFMFIVMDEMFSGTAPEKAQEISYEFISHMAEFPNCLFIDATHFSRLNDLEKTGMTTNYHMDITPKTLPNGSIRLNCTYKLLKGASQISNAMQLVKDEGISW